MQLQPAQLHLRPVIASDADDLFRIYGDPATNTFNPAGPYPDIHHAQAVLARWLSHWETHRFGNWAISLQDSPERIIGFGGLSISSYADISINNLGYRFATEAWGKGLATEFSKYSVRYGFEELKLSEISAVVRGDHLASQKVLQKAGLQYVREIHDVKDAPPSLLFSLTLSEWLRQSM
ncbi:GNAT family N-acetyltransferase [Dryocola sp. BD613]|uniref:GNAT family N-acetyltransferase n=1 Tax=Dryocola sp. BD613 TaxID=3133272 RepID=UPI003F4F88FF